LHLSQLIPSLQKQKIKCQIRVT